MLWRTLEPLLPHRRRRLRDWQAAGVWAALHGSALAKLGHSGGLDWSRASLNATSVRAKGGGKVGPRPTDRERGGTKLHLIVERLGAPLACLLSPANCNKCLFLVPPFDTVRPFRGPRGCSRKRPAKPHADKAYDHVPCREACRARGGLDRIARRGQDSSARPGHHQWVFERSFAWLRSLRRPAVHWERKADHRSPSPPSAAPCRACERSSGTSGCETTSKPGGSSKCGKFSETESGYLHVDAAERGTTEGKVHLFLAVDRVTKLPHVKLRDAVKTADGADFMAGAIDAFPYAIHAVLRDNGVCFADQPRYRNGATASFRVHVFDRVCRVNGITHRLIKPYHPWTNGQAGRMMRAQGPNREELPIRDENRP